MDKDAVSGLIAIVTAIIAVAIISVIVSKNSQTATVITAGGTALSGLLKAATGASAATTGLPPIGTVTS
jgi:hypothetical protein